MMNAPPPPPPPPPPPAAAGLPPPPPPPPPPPAGLPPPPPPLPVEVDTKVAEQEKKEREVQGAALLQACRLLEQARCQEAELEGLLYFATNLLEHKDDAPKTTTENEQANNDKESLPQVIQDALTEVASAHPQEESDETDISRTSSTPTSRAASGQWGKIVQTTLLSQALHKSAQTAAAIQAKRASDGAVLQESLTRAKKRPASTADVVGMDDRQVLATSWLDWMHPRRTEIASYHATSMDVDDDARKKRAKLVSNGFQVPIPSWLQPVQEETLFTTNEVMGKYLDLEDKADILQAFQAIVNHAQQEKEKKSSSAPGGSSNTTTSSLVYTDVLQILANGLNSNNPDDDDKNTLSEDGKLRHRKQYSRCLTQLQDYITSFLARTQPLLNVNQEIVQPAVKRFQEAWTSESSGVEGWRTATPAEKQQLVVATNSGNNDDDVKKEEPATEEEGIDLNAYKTAQDLAKAYESNGDALLAECARLGLKCGGIINDRAKRLFLTKGKPRSEWPKKVFPKGGAGQGAGAASSSLTQPRTQQATSTATTQTSDLRRVDLAQREAVVMALIDQVRPTLEATMRRAERRQGQTLQEREKEVEEDLYGAETMAASKKKKQDGDDSSDDEDEDDDEDAPIYNPKNVPLDWDGKPIPYWLFKLHGLNHYYNCEICGGESYRGRRNFELHFADNKHAFGMKSLGIPNTKHFHGVTKIEDAQNLWKTLQDKLDQDQFDGSKEEEYEDTHGNVLSRTQYEDLARQGLL